MSPFLFADNFLASSLLSLLLPACLVVALAVWYVLSALKVPHQSPPASPALPSADVVAAAPASDEITPAGPPPGDIL